MKTNFLQHLRITWAITAKDLIDAAKNKNVIAILVSSLFIVVMYRYLPALTREDGPPALLVYDAGQSDYLAALWDSPAVDLYAYESEEDMKYYLTNGDVPELGLVIPANFDAAVASASPVEIQGFMLHFFSEDEVYALKRTMEDEFSTLLDKPVTISIQKIHLQPNTHGITIMSSMGFVYISLMVGMLTIPHMMIEEKQHKTLDALMVSPARSAHIIIAKALTGLVYTFFVFVIALAFFWGLIEHIWLFLLGGLLGALFSISLGILMGVLFDNRQQLTLWAWVLIIPIFVPMFLSIMDDLLSPQLIQILSWVPSSAMMKIFRISMVGAFPIGAIATPLVILMCSSALILAVDAWLVRRFDH